MLVHLYNENGFRVVGVYDTGDKSEHYQQVVLGGRWPVFKLPNPAQTVGYQPILVNPGDVIQVDAEGQVTTERDTNTEIVSRLELWLPDGRRLQVSEENGENLDLQRHHHKLTGTGVIEIPVDVDPQTSVQIMWIWGAFDGSTRPNYLIVGNTLSNWKGYGRVTAVQLRPQ